ncbi:MAG: hypothetical protein JOZ62_14080 [Acidobacteriaceae bacterium]|nr:hypothetical protein [Acidobacteriaceae bacterium]
MDKNTLGRTGIATALLTSVLHAGLIKWTPATGDTRTVTEPSIPPICQTLYANLQSGNRAFSPDDEGNPPDTTRIAAALMACRQQPNAPAVSVYLAPSGPNDAFLTGPLTIPDGVVLFIDSTVTVFSSNNPANYQSSSTTRCGTSATNSNGCNPFITVTGSNAGIMSTRNGNTQGRIDGRGDINLFNQSISWWDVSNQAYASSIKQNNPRLIQARNANNFTLYDVDLVNAPLFHVYMEGGDGATLWGVRIKTPADTHNTDGIDPDSVSDVTINQCDIQDGDDGIAIKTNSGPASNITVENSNFYGTHGISIGSQTTYGVTNILVQNNTINGQDSSGTFSTDNNGLRIKTTSSSGGLVAQVTYTNTCMTNVKHILVFNPFYSTGDNSTIPNLANITVNGLKAINSPSGNGSTLEGYRSDYPLNLRLQHVMLDATRSTAEYANIGIFDSNLTASGTDVTVTPLPATVVEESGSLPACSSFPQFPF